MNWGSILIKNDVSAIRESVQGFVPANTVEVFVRVNVFNDAVVCRHL